MQLPTTFSFITTIFAALSFVIHTSLAHNVRQAHHDLDMLIQSCEWLRNDATCLTPETAAADGVEIVFGLHLHNEIMHFIGTKRIPKTKPYASGDEKAVNVKIEQYQKCMKEFLEDDLSRVLKLVEMKEYHPEIHQQLLRYQAEEPRCLAAVQINIVGLDIGVNV